MYPSIKYRYKIHDKLYDLTDFISIHPGGQDMFNHLISDANITPMIYAYHKNQENIWEILPKYEVPLTDDIIIKYDTEFTYDKYCELKKIVYDEIHEKKFPLYWSNKEIAYNAIMLSVYFGVWIYCFWNAATLSSWWMILLAIMNTGICNLIFHEVSHYCGFKQQKINNIITYIQYPFVVNSYWKHMHNYLHHNFTNSEYDKDFNYERVNTILRNSTSQKYNWYNKYQSIYSLFLFETTFLDNGINESIKLRTMNWICVPTLVYLFGIYKTLLWYLISAFFFDFTAQLSHIQHECIETNTDNKNNFLYNQVSSTMNYRTDDWITRFLCFGLDIQIEHHLFPNIPHSSLRKIQHIVRDYCDKNNIPYIEKPSVFHMIYSYIRHLHAMGNP